MVIGKTDPQQMFKRGAFIHFRRWFYFTGRHRDNLQHSINNQCKCLTGQGYNQEISRYAVACLRHGETLAHIHNRDYRPAKVDDAFQDLRLHGKSRELLRKNYLPDPHDIDGKEEFTKGKTRQLDIRIFAAHGYCLNLLLAESNLSIVLIIMADLNGLVK